MDGRTRQEEERKTVAAAGFGGTREGEADKDNGARKKEGNKSCETHSERSVFFAPRPFSHRAASLVASTRSLAPSPPLPSGPRPSSTHSSISRLVKSRTRK